MNGTWIVPFKGRNHSGAYDLNFLWRNGSIYVMDCHRAALWCWLQEVDLTSTHSILHIDQHTDTCQSRLKERLHNLPLLSELEIDEYLHHKFDAGPPIGVKPVFRWDNYLSIYFAQFGTAIKTCRFVTHEQTKNDPPNHPHVMPGKLWDIPGNLDCWLDENEKPWIVDIDLDYFFWDDLEFSDVMVSDAYLSACLTSLKKKIEDGVVAVTTICLTPHEDFTGGWEASEKLAARILGYLGIDFYLPPSC